MASARILAALDGYAVEGGLDTPDGPATCFAPTIALGRHAGPGPGEGLWHDYESVVDATRTLAIDGLRLSVEWARVEPRPGEIDDEAFARYDRLVRHARSRDLLVTVAIVDRAWPSWLGPEAWLAPWVRERLVDHAREVVSRLPLVTGVVVVADPAWLAAGYRDASAPPWRTRARRDARDVVENLAEVRARLVEDELVGPRLVRSYREVSLGPRVDPLALRSGGVDEVHLRSLVAGRGPTAAAAGLLVRVGGTWSPGPASRLLDALV
ncbi:MAG: family 1 glycosylhydrolase [Acidimicrobiales bacterium]